MSLTQKNKTGVNLRYSAVGRCGANGEGNESVPEKETGINLSLVVVVKGEGNESDSEKRNFLEPKIGAFCDSVGGV